MNISFYGAKGLWKRQGKLTRFVGGAHTVRFEGADASTMLGPIGEKMERKKKKACISANLCCSWDAGGENGEYHSCCQKVSSFPC